MVRLTSLFLLGVAAAGCQQEPAELGDVQVRLARLGNLYGIYIGQHSGRSPQSMEAFKKFAEERTTPDVLARLELSSVDELFVSPRDGQPFEMVTYRGHPPVPPPGDPPPLVFYEQQGKDGERAVAFLGGGTQFVAEATLQNMLQNSRGRN